MKRLSLLVTIFILLLSGNLMAGGPEVVSPSPSASSGQDVAVVGNSCPTFSWSEVGNAEGYTIEVYEMVTSDVQRHALISSIAKPVIARDVQRALSWTPSEGECLGDGKRYVWYVGARMDDAETEWSAGKVFEVNLLSNAETVNAMKETVSSYLRNEWINTDTYTQVKEEIKKEIKQDTGYKAQGGGDISIMGYEGTTNTLYGQGAGTNISNGGAGPPDYNTFIGKNAGYYTQSGSNYWDGDYNTFVGYYAGGSNTTGYSNTFMGFAARLL